MSKNATQKHEINNKHKKAKTMLVAGYILLEPAWAVHFLTGEDLDFFSTSLGKIFSNATVF